MWIFHFGLKISGLGTARLRRDHVFEEFFLQVESSFDPRGMRSNRKRDLPLQLFLLMRRKKLFAREDCRSCTQNLPKFLFVYCELSPTRAEPC
jgi:hypothetical protein